MFWIGHSSTPAWQGTGYTLGGATRSRPAWRRRLTWRTAVLLAAGCFVVGYPLYTYVNTLVTGGISRRGDLLVVDLKAMSNFDMDQDSGLTSDIPAIYRQLDGKRVLLTGQMYDPYAAGSDVRKFTLVYSITNCCFNGPPKVQHLVEATVLPGHKVEYAADYVNVTGTLHVGVRAAGGHIQSIYRIDVEKVQPD